jgi:hypothetical protein
MWLRMLASLFVVVASTANAAPLEPAGQIAMPGVKGRIDHFGVDVAGRRLFVAALGNDTVEVFDTAAGRHLRSIRGFGEPQGLLYVASSERLFVANGTADRVDVLHGQSFAVLRRVEPLPDADNLRLDPATRRVVVGYGKGALRFLDAATGESSTEIALSAHPESFQLESGGTRAFVNVPSAGHVAVVDRDKAKVVATWKVSGARAHFPMALDERGGRLFVGARSPAVMLVYETASGRVAAKLPICGDSDDIFFDVERRRVYVVCGEGRIDIFGQRADGELAREASLPTAPGARTGLFVPEDRRLYVAAPARAGAQARLLIFDAR